MHQIRRFDDLGRIAIPKEIREAATHVKNTEGVQMEVYMDDGSIVLKPHKPKDMVEVVHGEWIPEDVDYGGRTEKFKCSACGRIHFYGHYVRCLEYEFCPMCGAKMDGGDKR